MRSPSRPDVVSGSREAPHAPAPKDLGAPVTAQKRDAKEAQGPTATPKSAARAPSKPEPPPVPSYVRLAKAPPAGASWAPYYRAPWKRGFVTLFGHGKKWSGYLIGPRGEVPPASRASLSSMLASWRTGREALIDERLIALIALASDEFGGRPVRIVSGYRELSYAPDSKHKVGQAVDFSIPGVPNEALRDYLKTLADVGVGFYPNSTHVHLDVREKTTYWVDYSFPGERPHYAYEPPARGWGPRERAIADALDRLPSSLVAPEQSVPLSVGKPPPFAARPAPNRAVFAPTSGEGSRNPFTAASPDSPRPAAVTSAGDAGTAPQRAGGDSGFGFWSRAATAAPDGGAPTSLR